MPVMQEVRARFVAEIAGMRNAFNEVRREAQSLEPAVRRSTEQANRHYQKLSRSVTDLKDTLEETNNTELFKDLDKAAKRAQREFERTGQVSTRTMAALDRAINETSEQMDNLGDVSRANMGRLESVLADTRDAMDDLTSSAENAAEAVGEVGDTNLDGANRQLGETADELENVQDRAESVRDEFERLGRTAETEADRTGTNLGRMAGEFANTSDRAFQQATRGAQRFRGEMDRLNPFNELEREARQLERTIGRPIENLPEHLRPFRESLVETQMEFRNLSRGGSESIDSLSRAATRSIIPARSLASMTSSGKEAAKMVQQLTEDTRTARLAVMGLNEDGTVQISTEESERRLESFRENVDRTRERLEALRDAGDQGSYNAGIINLERSLRDVDVTMRAVATGGGTQYNRMLRDMGIYTADTANLMGINMERMRSSFFYNLDMMQARSTLSQKMMDFLPETSRIQRLDRFFLGISNGLERIAVRGSAANIAVEMLGRNAPMKKIMDLTRMINQGVMGVQQLTMGATIVFGIFTGVMAKAATGPSPSEVAEEAGKALAKYHEELTKRADEIMNTWNLFMDIQLEAVNPHTLNKNLREQVDVLGAWEKDLNELTKRIDNVDIMAYLRGLGPDAAMEIQALNDHSEAGLNRWVELFKEKSEIATRAAMTELEWLRVQTDLEIKKMQDSLTPLSIAWENFLQTWASAMTPFVNTWGIVAAKVVDAWTAVGKFIEALNDLTPQLSAMAGMFAYVASGLFILLAPLGVGIGLIRGMRANFSQLFLMLKPAVVAFFRVAGAVTVVSAALVIIGTAFYNLWTNSERLRNAIGELANSVQIILAAAFRSIQEPLDLMKTAFNNMVASFLGEGKKAGDFWTSFGDLIALVIENATRIYLPAFAAGIRVLRDAVVAGINIMTLAFDEIRKWWEKASPMIMPLITSLFSTMQEKSQQAANGITTAFNAIKDWWSRYGPPILDVVKTVFGEIANFVGSILKKIVDFFKTDGAQLIQAASNVFNFIGNIVAKVFNAIWAVAQFVWPAVLWLIESIWKNIQGVINGALNIIFGLLKVFSGLFTGDFAKMWEGIKQLFMGAVEFVFNLVSLLFFAKILKGAMLFATMMRSGLVSMWNAIKALFTGSGGAVVEYTKRAFSDIWKAISTVIKNVWTYLKNTWDSIVLITRGFLNTTSSIFTVGFTNISNFISRIWNGILNFFSTIFIRIFTNIRDRMLAIENTMRTIGTAVWNTVKTIFTGIYNTISTIIRATFTFIKDIFNAIRTFLGQTLTNIWTAFTAGWRNIRVTTETVFRSIRDFLKGLWNGVRDFVVTIVGTIFQRVKNTWTSLRDATKTAFTAIFNAIKDRFTNIVNAAKELPGRIGNAIKSMSSAVTGGVTSLINAMSATLGKGMNGVIKGLNWVLDKIGVKITIPPYNAPSWNSSSPAPAKTRAPAGKMRQYAKGTDNHPGGMALINDGRGELAGEEIVIEPDGKSWIAKGRDVLVNLAQGAQVINAQNTKKLLAGHFHPAYATGKGIINTVLNLAKYAKNPSGLLNLALETLGVKAPSMNAYAGDVVKGGYKKVKDSAIDVVKDKLGDFLKQLAASRAANQGAGGGKNILSGMPARFPAPFRFTSGPGPRNTGIKGASRYHMGWDWAAPKGTPIPSVSSGVVSRTGYNSLSGNFIEVKSGDKIHRYQHNTRNAASYGQKVSKGQTIAYVGATGVGSGPHLHYELKRFENGGIATQEQLAWIADGGFAESIISHDPSKKASQREIWNRTGDMLGFEKVGDQLSREMLAVLERIANGVETDKDIAVVMSDRKVGQLVSKHSQREAEIEKYRADKFKGVMT